MMWAFYVYLHRRADTEEPFYVGKGKLRRAMRSYERAHELRENNKHWTRVVSRHGLLVEILAHCKTDQDAQYVERLLIAQFGRSDLKQGPLINRTDGGEGHAGILVSADLRAKRSKAAKGKRSPAWVASIRASRKGGGNGGVVKRGDKLPDSWVRNIAKAKMGALNPMAGKVGAKHPNGRKVRDAATGIVYPTLLMAAEVAGLPFRTPHNRLSGHRVNNTTMEFA